jgi:O-acetyl-ADP-ribose deacetylase (regulator of RNase III)
MIKRHVCGLTIECVQGNIADQPDMDAVVNAANAQLKMGGGVAGAIHKAAGPELEKLCRPFAPIKPGQAVITPAGNLPNKYVIHCLGPVYGQDNPSDVLLADCYENALKLVEENQISSVGFCAISAGVFGYPLPEALEVAFKTIIHKAPELEHLKIVRFVLFSKNYLNIAEKVLSLVLG